MTPTMNKLHEEKHMNVVEHPRRRKRIQEARNKLFNDICAAGLEKAVRKLRDDIWLDRALIAELDTPGAGVVVVESSVVRGSFDKKSAA
jgi:hypothetical protein